MRICRAHSKARDGSVQRKIQSGKNRYKGIARRTQEWSQRGEPGSMEVTVLIHLRSMEKRPKVKSPTIIR